MAFANLSDKDPEVLRENQEEHSAVPKDKTKENLLQTGWQRVQEQTLCERRPSCLGPRATVMKTTEEGWCSSAGSLDEGSLSSSRSVNNRLEGYNSRDAIGCREVEAKSKEESVLGLYDWPAGRPRTLPV
jgi:hypothetical protein